VTDRNHEDQTKLWRNQEKESVRACIHVLEHNPKKERGAMIRKENNHVREIFRKSAIEDSTNKVKGQESLKRAKGVRDFASHFFASRVSSCAWYY